MLAEDKRWLMQTLDCGDNSCLFRDRSKPSGVRTNGGCRCFEELTTRKRRFVHKMFAALTNNYKDLKEIDHD